MTEVTEVGPWRSQWVPSGHDAGEFWDDHVDWRRGYDHCDHAVIAAEHMQDGEPDCDDPAFWSGGHMLVEDPNGVIERIPLELEYEPEFIAYPHAPLPITDPVPKNKELAIW